MSIVEHSLLSLSKCGVKNAVIVVGYLADQVRQTLGNQHFGVRIKYVFNPLYDYHSSQYSISLAEAEIDNCETLVIEGDILLHHKLFAMILKTARSSAVLVDTRKRIEAKRSVVVLGKNGIVESFVYDPLHKNVFDLIHDPSKIVGESMQVWKFSSEGSKALSKDLRSYRRTLGNEKDTRNNLYSINRVIRTQPMRYLDSQGLPWQNVNTVEDIKKAEGMDLEE